MHGTNKSRLHINNKEIVEGLISGEKTSFEAIFNLYYKRLLFYAKEFVLSFEVAKELTQDTFMKIWEIRETLTPNSNISALLFTILRNKCLNHLKHQTQETRYAKNAQLKNKLLLNKTALENNIFDPLVYNELAETIAQTIETLPPRCREIFRLSRNRGLSYKKIAHTLGISVNTVENQMVSSLKKIREAIQRYNNL